MVTISVLSDTHGNLAAIEKALPVLETCNYVFHLGDCASDMKGFKSIFGDRLITVRGNCDMTLGDRYKIVEIENKRLLITHGDMFGVKTSLNRLSVFAEEQGVDAVFFGHTHTPFCKRAGGTLFVNPGAMSRMQPQKSFAYVTIADGKVNCSINYALLADMQY